MLNEDTIQGPAVVSIRYLPIIKGEHLDHFHVLPVPAPPIF